MSPGANGGEWDVVVVGAGPAGACAARSAAETGARTLLIERAQLLRYKTCGGGLVGASLAALPQGIRPPTRERITAVTFSLGGGLRRTHRDPAQMVEMINRDEFDAALTSSAVECGATLLPGTVVRGIDAADGHVTLTTSAGAVTARAVVGADGTSGRTGRHVGVTCGQVDLGLEVEVAADPATAAAWAGRVQLDWGPLPGSYGWVFPKGDALTVGVISARGDGDAVRDYLRRFVGQVGLADHPVIRSSGHLTRCRDDRSPLVRGRVLVAGDAAGLLEPWTREGISYALRSGRIAGAAAARMARADGAQVAELGTTYAAEIDGSLGAEMRAGRAIMAAYTRRPRAFHAAIAAGGPTWRTFMRLTRGDTTFPRVMRHRPVAALVSVLAR